MACDEIKQTMKQYGVVTWQVADLVGVSESTLYRRFRHELPDAEKDKIINLIVSTYGESEVEQHE